jgi:phosphoglycolate phosphatase-like HAD superfamily hydrolase
VSIARRDPVLVLWDVDHTLVSIAGVGRALYERAFPSVVGRPLGRLAAMAGRTERAILHETLRLNGVDPSKVSLPRFYAALGMAARELAGHIRATGRPLPGAREAIAALGDGRAVQSLVTGNVRPVADVKLAAFGLTDGIDLGVGGYGDDGSDRAILVRRARERAEATYGVPFPGKRTFVIGDTPHDIAGAHQAGAFAVAVATGNTPPDALTACGADLVLADLTRLAELLHAVSGVRIRETAEGAGRVDT